MTSSTQKQLKSKPNHLYATLSIALVLFILGLYGIFVLYGTHLIAYYKENVEVMVNIKPNTPKPAQLQLEQTIKNSLYAKPYSVKLVPKEEGAMDLQDKFGDNFLELDLSHPLLDVIVFNVKAAYVSMDSLELISEQLTAHDVVEDVFYEQIVVGSVEKNISRFGWYAILLSLLLIVIAISLINNTVKLSLYSNRFLIKNMQLVGATPQYISRPYLIKSLINGCLSTLIAALGVGGILYFIQQDLPELTGLLNPTHLLLLLTGLLVLSIAITMTSTAIHLNKYLKMQLDDLYH